MNFRDTCLQEVCSSQVRVTAWIGLQMLQWQSTLMLRLQHHVPKMLLSIHVKWAVKPLHVQSIKRRENLGVSSLGWLVHKRFLRAQTGGGSQEESAEESASDGMDVEEAEENRNAKRGRKHKCSEEESAEESASDDMDADEEDNNEDEDENEKEHDKEPHVRTVKTEVTSSKVMDRAHTHPHAHRLHGGTVYLCPALKGTALLAAERTTRAACRAEFVASGSKDSG